MLPIIFAVKFLQLLPHLLHSDNDRHDPEEIFCQMQEILHLQTISLKLPDILAELENSTQIRLCLCEFCTQVLHAF